MKTTLEEQQHQKYATVRVLGLTGGIASGKSTICEIFSAQGVPIIDADSISRELVTPGKPALASIEGYFGKNFVINGELQRSLLRTEIFSNEESRLWLEALLHPLIQQEIRVRIESTDSPWVVLVAPLLLESSDYNWVHKIAVVDTTEILQLERTQARDKVDKSQVETIISKQMSRNERLQKADYVLHNCGTLESLQEQTMQLYRELEKLWHDDPPSDNHNHQVS
jgi:dephospho-CoA kinase